MIKLAKHKNANAKDKVLNLPFGTKFGTKKKHISNMIPIIKIKCLYFMMQY